MVQETVGTGRVSAARGARDPIPTRDVGPYFRRLRLRLKLALLAAFLLPLGFLSLYFHFQFEAALRETGRSNLLALARSRCTAMDLRLRGGDSEPDTAAFAELLSYSTPVPGTSFTLLGSDGRFLAAHDGLDESLGDGLAATRRGSGVIQVGSEGGPLLVAYSWLENAPMALVVAQSQRLAYARMYSIRRILLGSALLLVFLFSAAGWVLVDRLMRRAQATAESREMLQTRLVQASKMATVGELAAGIAHEINNPLAIIGATCQNIKDAFDPRFRLSWTPEWIRRELETAEAAVIRARGITRKLLNFSRKGEPALTPANVNRVLNEVVGGLKERELYLDNIRVVRVFDPNIPETLLDVDQIGQVFLNLVNNAGDAVAGPGTITLVTHKEDGWIRVTVSDTGAGIAPDVMKKIFLPFFTTKEIGKGTGLGLSISLDIVESLGGRIEVESEPGSGSSFHVMLPIVNSEVASDES